MARPELAAQPAQLIALRCTSSYHRVANAFHQQTSAAVRGPVTLLRTYGAPIPGPRLDDGIGVLVSIS